MKISILARRVIYIGLGYIDTLIRRKNNLFVLCYHSISSDDWRYGVSLSEFKKQISYLQKNYQIISTEELGLFIQNKKKLQKPSVAITFDDGYADILSTREFLKKQNIQPTEFIIADSKKANRQEIQTSRRLLTKKEILSLLNAGWIIGGHSMTHADFSRLNTSSVSSEVVGSKSKLEKELNLKVNSIAYPKGKYSNDILKAAKVYPLGFSMDDGFITKQTNPLTIPRIGVDRSHSFEEFKYLHSPSVMFVRSKLKGILGGAL